jgi:hypothetical protein
MEFEPFKVANGRHAKRIFAKAGHALPLQPKGVQE